MQSCSRCQKPVATAKIAAPGYPKGKWTTFEPLLSTTGVVVEKYAPNGRNKITQEQLFAWRPVPSNVKHVCGQTSPVQSDLVFNGRSNSPVVFNGPSDSPPVVFNGPSDSPAPAPAPRVTPAPQPTQDPAPAPAPVAPAPIDLESILPRLRAEVVEVIKSFGIEPPTSKIEVVLPNGETRKADGITHPALADLIPYVARGENVYLTGPAGSGKTFGALQAAALCGLRGVVITCPGISVAKLMGGQRADGEITWTPFLDVWANGGVAVLDEFDRMDPGVAAMLNSALENATYTHGTTVIKRSAKCAIVANGNTALRGATREYTAAKPLDYSTAARFPFIEWGYDTTHQDAMAAEILGSREAGRLVTAWTRKVHQVLKRDRVELVWSGPRESTRISQELKRGVSFEKAAHRWIWRGLDTAIVERIIREVPYPAIEVEVQK